MHKASILKFGGALALSAALGTIVVSASPSDKFTIAVIPDTQNYCDVAAASSPQPASTQIFQRETQYLANQKTAQNIVFVTHVGDVVQHGDLYDGEWQNAKSAMDILAASGIPFGLTPGNHDYDNYSHTTNSRPLAGSSKWLQYFGPDSAYFSGKSWFGGSHPDSASFGLSSYQTFGAGGKIFLHISLEMEASDDTLAWAKGVIASHPGLPTIVTTHEYLSYQNDTNGVAIRLQDGYMVGEANNQPQALWDKFIAQNDQIFLVICGHNWSSTNASGISDGENLRVDNNRFGHPVYQVLSDYQGNTFDASGTPGVLTGGAGWLRLMTFDPKAGTIHFQTYSSELNEYAGVSGGPTFGLAASMSDFTLPIPDRVFGPWKFGVLSDTQWTSANDGKSPESIPAAIIQQVDRAFIAQGVKLVVSVGDVVDTPTVATLETRALYSQDLYNAGIGFYPLRGNHESELTNSGANFATLFPQIVNDGWNNLTPASVNPLAISGLFNSTDTGFQSAAAYLTQLSTNIPPAAVTGSSFQVGGNFSYPSTNCPLAGVAGYPGTTTGNGVSYSFDYNNVRFVLIDQFMDSSLGGNTSSAAAQLPWIGQQLSGSARPTHAFVFSHKQLVGGNHKDNLFGGNVNSADPGDGAAGIAAGDTKRAAIDSFITTLASNNVRYYITGHDHHHSMSLVQSPLTAGKFVHQIISQSDSSKFYTPAVPFSSNQTMISEDLYQVGYYIYTVDGPRVTADYYSVPANTTSTFAVEPVLTGNWQKALTFGYSLNGQEFLVAQGASYTSVTDNTAKAIASAATYGEDAGAYVGTTVQILGGTNGSALKTKDGRKLTKAVNTGWAPANGTLSDIVTLWGLTDVAASQTDTIIVSVGFNTASVAASDLAAGKYCLGSRDLKSGAWINAVDDNLVGGTKLFVYGPYTSGYALGTYGIDPVAHTAWAVVNGPDRDFAVIATPTAPLAWDFDGNGTVNTADLALLTAAIKAHSTSPVYDLTGDGKVDASDTRWLTLHFTNTGGR